MLFNAGKTFNKTKMEDKNMTLIVIVVMAIVIVAQANKIKKLKKENKQLKNDQQTFRKEAEKFINKCMR